jgi:hypothetical protein
VREAALWDKGSASNTSSQTISELLAEFYDFGVLAAEVMIPTHYGTFRGGRETMDEPLPRLLRAAESAGVSGSISALGEIESLGGGKVGIR